ncbi:MAG: 50S ribosomal protein L24 [Clostridiales bacterium]|nr:50S ribosomal protein L24 [Clostridiales bacterium]
MNKLHVKTGDTVEIISGKEKGKRGKILSADPAKGLVIVEGLNIHTKHKKARRQTEESEIVKVEGAIRACKVMRVCPKCDKTTRPAHKLADGKKTTVCKKCGAEI